MKIINLVYKSIIFQVLQLSLHVGKSLLQILGRSTWATSVLSLRHLSVGAALGASVVVLEALEPASE